VAARSEGGRVEVNNCSATMTKSLRKMTVVTRSEAGVEVAACSGAEDEVVECSGAGIQSVRLKIC
jgi:hypothetical protein